MLDRGQPVQIRQQPHTQDMYIYGSLQPTEILGRKHQKIFDLIAVIEALSVLHDRLPEIAVIMTHRGGLPITEHLENLDKIHVMNAVVEVLGVMIIENIMML